MHVPWAVEALPTLLHLSLFLFFGGLAIFLFNVDEEVFTCVVWWIGLFSTVYGLITLLPLIWHDSPYNTPLSKPVWFLYASISYVIVLFIRTCYDIYDRSRRGGIWRDRIEEIWWNYHCWILEGMETIVDGTVVDQYYQSSEIVFRILGWTLGALGDDDLLEKFFQVIPGLFNSKLVENLETNFPGTLFFTFWYALQDFMDRTLSSNLVKESVKSRRVDICKDIASIIPRPFASFPDRFSELYDQEQVSIERTQLMARWLTQKAWRVSDTARIRVAKNLARIKDRDSRWIALASDVSGLSENVLRHDLAIAGDNMLLATVIYNCRQDFRFNDYTLGFIEGFSGSFDIRRALPRLQNDFCTLWNVLVREAREQEPDPTPVPVFILREIRQLYISLHQGTNAAPTAFSISTAHFDNVLRQPSSYPLCNIHSHRPNSTAHGSITDSPTVPRQVKEVSNAAGSSSPFDPTTPSKIGHGSQVAAAAKPALPVHISSYPTDASPTSAVAAALQDTSPVTPLPHALEGNIQRDLIAAGASASSNPLLLASSVTNTPIPTSPPSHPPTFPTTESLAFLRSTTPSLPTGSATVPRLRARGLVNTGGMCFANAVLQLLVHSPPFWNMLKELRDLRGQHGTGDLETGGGATPLADATLRFFEEFMFEEKPSPTQQPLRQAAGVKLKDGDEAKMEHNAVDSFEPVYMYGAMKKNRQLQNLLVCSRAT
jgi:hypothetical protein